MAMEWKLETDHGVTVLCPDWSQIYKVLAQMDGNTLSMVSLDLAGKGCLLAGGGDKGRYIVVYFPENNDSDSLTLADLSLVGPAMELTVEGITSGPFPAKLCVKQPLMVKAFKHFFDTGDLASDLTWESDR